MARRRRPADYSHISFVDLLGYRRHVLARDRPPGRSKAAISPHRRREVAMFDAWHHAGVTLPPFPPASSSPDAHRADVDDWIASCHVAIADALNP